MSARQSDGSTSPTSRPSYDDLRVESMVVACVVSAQGAPLTIPQLALELAEELGDDDASDMGVERAVRELVRARLLRCEGAFVMPDLAGEP